MISEHMKFSVLMCIYEKDKKSFIKEAIDSIINQTKQPDEIVIIVDGKINNDIEKLLDGYKAKYNYFKIHYLHEMSGLGNALRIGIEKCSHDLVARMDADDISCLSRFEIQLAEFAKDKTLSLLGGNINEFEDSVENIISKRVVPQSEEEIAKCIKIRNPFNHMTVMFKKSDVILAGNYENFYGYEDYFLWAKMFLKNMRLKNVEDILVNARISKETYKRRGGWKYYKSTLKLQKFLLKNGIIKLHTYLYNVTVRFFIQVLTPNFLREIIYKKVIRKKYTI